MESMWLGSILSALATGAGALPVLFMRSATHRFRDILLALTAGIMMAASTFSLIPQALSESNLRIVTLGIFMGVILLTLIGRVIPHFDLESKMGNKIDKKTLLIITAITMHNLPEGLSVGVSYADNTDGLGALIAFAIGLQNAPEGFLVGLFLVNQNISRFAAIAIATLTGAVEIVTAFIGFQLTQYVEGLVPYGLSFAAGAMLYIVYKELIPESHGDGHETAATYAFISGLLVMIYLIHWFGG
ncbi:dihydroorotate dehydrogenase [Paenibacillus swuensis]|uniref:Dihydroorotate dehydrogenase n=1 Tax=Paenibacillus swuensis TaxID=1178515 RepID=A0A172TH22_9BACL|nr:ZIP family metal transporter [Paenibacillus swuensis]ANE46341.1 dihydroorotate dehydrogenase [Paenibacillus swuensis]